MGIDELAVVWEKTNGSAWRHSLMMQTICHFGPVVATGEFHQVCISAASKTSRRALSYPNLNSAVAVQTDGPLQKLTASVWVRLRDSRRYGLPLNTHELVAAGKESQMVLRAG